MLLFTVVSRDTIDDENGDKIVAVWAGWFCLMFCMCLLLGKLKVKLRMRRAIRQERARKRKVEEGRQNNE